MKIKNIEPTPSPNTMKIIIDETLPFHQRYEYSLKSHEGANEEILKLLQIPGVLSIYRASDFLAIDRHSKMDWRVILPTVREILGEELVSEEVHKEQTSDFGEIKVLVQFYTKIPMQVKVSDGLQEFRVSLPARFRERIFAVQKIMGNNVISERVWVDYGVRFGVPEEVANEVAEELDAVYTEAKINEVLIEQNISTDVLPVEVVKKDTSAEDMKSDDWKMRYRFLEKLLPKEEHLGLLEAALSDEKVSIRRLVTAYLGIIGGDEVVPLLHKALKDSSVSVRRTAGDVFSDLGLKEAQPAMIETLKDKSKLVRWRAAMFLYETGDETAIPALQAAINDPEFEVSLQAKMALNRITSGEEAKGSIWKQMLEGNSN